MRVLELLAFLQYFLRLYNVVLLYIWCEKVLRSFNFPSVLHKMWEISLLPEIMSASQEVLYSVELLVNLFVS
jgi:hypothetical protein